MATPISPTFYPRLKEYEPLIFRAWEKGIIHIEPAYVNGSKHTRILVRQRHYKLFSEGEIKIIAYIKDHGTTFDAIWTDNLKHWEEYDYRPNSRQMMKEHQYCNPSIDQLRKRLRG